MITILHAYSRQNRGDGLLLDASLDLVSHAIGNGIPITVVAADAKSFHGGHFNVLEFPAQEGSSRTKAGLVGLGHLLAASWPRVGYWGRYAHIAALVRRSRLVLGIGGGYLRAKTLSEATKTSLVHLPQLQLAAQNGARALYLPQSIGPLRGITGAGIKSRLGEVRKVFVRDDRSEGELAGFTNVMRMPDLAVMMLARNLSELTPRSATAGPVLVARDLPVRGYSDWMRQLIATIPGLRFAVQSDTRGNDDRKFYERLGISRPVALARLLEEGPPGVVVSVRLHGSLQALLAGWPTVHLSYERKGFGAFADLSLDDFVWNAGAVDPGTISDSVRRVEREPGCYWARIASTVDKTLSAEESLREELRRTYAG